MATLSLAPFGLRASRLKSGAAANYEGEKYLIGKGYTSAIAKGDLVYTLPSGPYQGYIAPYPEGGTHILGVFLGVGPYYDTVAGPQPGKQFWSGTESPSSDVVAYVIDDPTCVFVAQVSGGPATYADRGKNIDFGGGGAPNASGLSVGYLDYTTVNTLASAGALRIIGFSPTMVGGSVTFDPTLASSYGTTTNQPTNNWLEVIFNPSFFEHYIGTGY
jgi:hypothetical protein